MVILVSSARSYLLFGKLFGDWHVITNEKCLSWKISLKLKSKSISSYSVASNWSNDKRKHSHDEIGRHIWLLFIAVSQIWQMTSLRLFCDKIEKGREMRFLKEFGSQAISAERDNHSDSQSTIDGIMKAINHTRVEYPFEIIDLLECIARHLKDSSNARTLWRLLVYFLVPFAPDK